MPIPSIIMARVLGYVLRTAPRAYNRTGRVIQKFVAKRFGRYTVEIERRDSLGADGGISHIVRFLLQDATREAWHIVVKAGRIIHKHKLQ